MEDTVKTNYMNTLEILNKIKEVKPDVKEFSLEELIRLITKSGNELPPRRGLKDRTYRQILINQVTIMMNKKYIIPGKMATKRQQKRYNIREGVDAAHIIMSQ